MSVLDNLLIKYAKYYLKKCKILLLNINKFFIIRKLFIKLNDFNIITEKLLLQKKNNLQCVIVITCNLYL